MASVSTSTFNNPGANISPTNKGNETEGSGAKTAGGPARGALSSSALAGLVAGAPRGAGGRGPPGAPQRPPPTASAFQAAPAPKPNLQLGGPPVAPPHPGMRPPYPDARSVAATIMPDGQPVMPPPTGFLQAGMIPRVPPSMVPHMSPGSSAGPPTMPPIHQSHMPTMANSMQMAHLPPGGAPMPQRPGQIQQVLRKPGAPLGAPPGPTSAPPGALPGRPPAGPPGGMGAPPALMGRPPGGVARPVPGGPPVKAPDGNFYVHAPHATGLYRRVS